MFATVLVPLDGSRHAEAAIAYGVEEARHHGASLVLLRVIPRPEPCPGGARRAGPAAWGPDWPADEIAKAERATRRYMARVIERFGLPRETRVRVVVGDPAARLIAEAARTERPLVVMTTGDAEAATRTPLSEVARRLLVNGEVPVLGVREPAPVPAAAHQPAALADDGGGSDPPRRLSHSSRRGSGPAGRSTAWVTTPN